MEKHTKKIITYLLVTVLFSSYFYYSLIKAGRLEGNDLMVVGLMWAPAVGAIITKLIFDKSLKGLGWKLGKLKFIAAAYLIPPICALAVYSFVWITRLGGVTKPSIIRTIVLATLGVLMSCLTATGEEIGWRGFLVPELFKKFSFIKTTIIGAFIWYLYHLPLILFSNYNNGVSIAFSLVFFGIMITAFSFIANYLRLRSGSLWTGVMIHASHNLFIQSIFDVMTIDKGTTKYITTEFGVGLAVAYGIVAVWIIRRVIKDRVLESKQ